MAKNINLKKLSLNDIKIIYRNFRKKISSNYLCIELGYDHIQLAETFFSKNSIGYKNVLKKDLPSEALDKGIPSDPETMGNLIKNILKERNINLKRTAITLSADSIYTRLIEIPNNIADDKVIKYLLDPSSLIQIPIALDQTDFNVFKTSYQINKSNNSSTYFFIAMPKVSMNKLIETCENAGLELLYVESASNSILRLFNIKNLVEDDNKKNFCIMLDLLSNCTQMTLLDELGPIYTSRLTSIREYSMGKVNTSPDSNQKYLPISKLDLKVLVNEIRREINNFLKENNEPHDFKILLTGKNSSHPNLTKIFADTIKLPTYLVSPSGSSLINEVNLVDQELLESNFTKLFGLGLGLLDINDQRILNKINRPISPIINFIEYEVPEKQVNLLKKKSSGKESVFREKNLYDKKKKENSDPSNLVSNEVIDPLKEKIESKFNLDIDKKEKAINFNEKNLNKENSNKDPADDSENEIKDKSDFKLDTDFLDLN